MVTRRAEKFRYAVITLDNVNSIGPYFNKMGNDGWELVAVNAGMAFFKRSRSTTLNEDIIEYKKFLEKELEKYADSEKVEEGVKDFL